MIPRKLVIELNEDNETYNMSWNDMLVYTRDNPDGIVVNMNVPKSKIEWNNNVLPIDFTMLNNNTGNLFTMAVKE